MYGVVDIGSNTIRLVIYHVHGNKIQKAVNKKYMVGLAGYITDEGEMTKFGVAKINRYAEKISSFCWRASMSRNFFMFATASLRNINNTEKVLDQVKEETGFDIRILSGSEEAEYGYYGLLLEGARPTGIDIDVGGGSTELVLFNNSKIEFEASIPLGSLVLFDEYVSKIVPKKKEAQAIRNAMERKLCEFEFPQKRSTDTLFVEGGSGRATLKLLRQKYPDAIRGNTYNVRYLRNFLNFYFEEKEECTRLILKTSPDRIHTAIPGMIAIDTVVDHFDSNTITTISNGVREGFLWHMLNEEETNT